MELSLIGLQNAGKTSLVNVIAVCICNFLLRKQAMAHAYKRCTSCGPSGSVRIIYNRKHDVFILVYVIPIAWNMWTW